MAYATTNPPVPSTVRIGGGGDFWKYASTDAAATVAGADYISNGTALGMSLGDAVRITETDNSYLSVWATVTAVGTTAVTVTLDV